MTVAHRKIRPLMRALALGAGLLSLYFLTDGRLDRLGLVLGPVDWRANALAVTALALTWISRRPDRSRTGVLSLGSILALVTLVVPPLGRVPYLRRELTYLDHALGWLGLASTQDLWSPDLGPRLLVRQAVTRGLLGQDPFDLRGMSLAYVGLRLQGRAQEEVMGGMGDPRDRHRLLLGTLLDEAEPPRWWREAQWIRDRLATRPDGTLRMGLIPRETARRELMALAHREPLALGERQALVLCLGLHPGLLPPTESDAALAAWSFHGAPGKAVEAVLAARRVLASLASRVARGDLVALRVEPASPRHEALTAAVRTVLERLLGTSGYRTEPGGDLRIEFGVEEREYRNALRGFSHVVAAGERSVATKDEEIRLVGTGRTRVPLRTSRYGTRSETRWVRQEESRIGTLRAPVLVLSVAESGDGVSLEAPPFGFAYLEGAESPRGATPATWNATSDEGTETEGLPSRNDLLFRAWTLGIPVSEFGIR